MSLLARMRSRAGALRALQAARGLGAHAAPTRRHRGRPAPCERQRQAEAEQPARHATRAAQLPGLATAEEWPEMGEAAPVQPTARRKQAGPLAGLQGFWAAYNGLLERRPVLTKSLTSFVGFLLGDVLAQLITGNPYSGLRTLRMVLFGVLMDGPVGHLWYTTLDRTVCPDRPKSNTAVLGKMAADQLVWAPAFTCVFFTFMACLESRPHTALAAIQAKLVPVMLTNYAIWPLAHIINFKFIPSSQRILYINCCQIVWSCYLSMTAAC